jgi:hypothetical protein
MITSETSVAGEVGVTGEVVSGGISLDDPESGVKGTAVNQGIFAQGGCLRRDGEPARQSQDQSAPYGRCLR